MSKWISLGGFLMVLFCCSLMGCNNEPCDPETEECEDETDITDIRRGGILPYKPKPSVEPVGGVLPYEPEDIAVIEQAATVALPRMVDVMIAPIAGGWSLAGKSNWLIHVAKGEYYKERIDVYKTLPSSARCYKQSGQLAYQITCFDPNSVNRYTTYNCPSVNLTAIKAYQPSTGGAGVYGTPYGFRTEPGGPFPGSYIVQEGTSLHCMSTYAGRPRFRLVKF